jgi:hypothetical protein
MLADDLSALYVCQSTKTSDDDLRVTHMQVRLQYRDLLSIQLKVGIILKLTKGKEQRRYTTMHAPPYLAS